MVKVKGKHVPGEVAPLPTEDVVSVGAEVALGAQSARFQQSLN